MRGYLGVPATAVDGAVMGVLFVVWRTARNAQDQGDVARLTARLEALAAIVAHDFEQLNTILALEQAGQRSRTLLDSVPVSLVMTDTDATLLEATPRWLADYGFARDEAVGKRLYDVGSAYFYRFQPYIDRCLAGETIRIGRFRLPNSTGRRGWLQAELTPWYDARGAIGGVIGAAIDITDTVEALEAAERAAERLQFATELAELHVWEVDYGRRVVETAGARETFFDREFEDAELVEDTSITVDPRDRARADRELAEATAEGRPCTIEYRIARSDGQEVWAACRIRLLSHEDGRPDRLLGAMQNITARKLSETALTTAKDEAEAANRAKSNFLATMSHEIRTPLNGVLGMAQALAAGELAPAQRDQLDVIQKSGQSLLAILNDILDLSKIEAGRMEIEAVEFDLGEIAQGALGAFTALANKKGLSFNLEMDAARGVYLGDPTRIRQILYNLISNALKFTESGEIRVTLAYDGAELVAAVHDSGIGMSQDVQSALFQKFSQADASTTRRFGGTGLGLAICRQLAEMMAGSITVVSEPGAGAVFTFRAPLPRIGDARAPAAVEAAPPEAAALHIRVLAAEDNSVNQLVLKTLLHQVGVVPVVVENGQLALEAWEASHWDVILMDVQMPVMDGPTAVRAIRAREALTGRARTPIIALTANAMSHQRAEYAACGMDGHVGKPIEAAKLFQALEDALDGAEALPEEAPRAQRVG